MDAVVKKIIPDFINKGMMPKVLSVPCAQGEEPYTLLMMLQERGLDMNKIMVTGIDIASSSIEKAREGEYTDYALRQVPLGFLRRHFSALPGTNPQKYRVNPELKRHTHFERMNLLTEAPKRLGASKFHVIFCQNLLIYFDQETINNALKILMGMLHPDGYLIVDPTEGPQVAAFMKPMVMGTSMVYQLRSETNKTDEPQPWKQLYEKEKQVWPENETIAPANVQVMSTQQLEIKRAQKRNELNKVRGADFQGKDESEDILEKARRAYKTKRFQESITLYEQLQADHPRWAAKPLLGQAMIYADEGKNFQAMECAEMALSETSLASNTQLTREEKAEAHAIIAIILKDKGLHKEAKYNLNKLKKLNPKHPVAKMN